MNITVAIVDRGGHVQVALRDTLAMPLSLKIAEQKAYAAMNFNAPTSEMADRFTSPFSPGKVQGIILSAGGLPITAGGSILGAIGVSGRHRVRWMKSVPKRVSTRSATTWRWPLALATTARMGTAYRWGL